MFEEAVKKVGQYTRSINTIQRAYGSDKPNPIISTLFFVNDEGVAITTRHTLEMLSAGEQAFKKYREFLAEKANLHDDYRYEMELEELAEKYHYTKEAIVDMRNMFIACVDGFKGFQWHLHPKYDLAIIEFKDFNKKLYNGHAVFTKQKGAVPPGKFLCRLGYAFPEFTNFKYDEKTGEMSWTDQGRINSPIFPVAGMVTRTITDEVHPNAAIELSSTSYRGMDGGPLFDSYGVVYGMIARSVAVPNALNPVPFMSVVNGENIKAVTSPFAMLGHCISADVIKDFLKEHNIKYYEEDLYGGKYAN